MCIIDRTDGSIQNSEVADCSFSQLANIAKKWANTYCFLPQSFVEEINNTGHCIINDTITVSTCIKD